MKKITLIVTLLVAVISYGQTISGFVTNPSFDDGPPYLYQEIILLIIGDMRVIMLLSLQPYRQLKFMMEPMPWKLQIQ